MYNIAKTKQNNTNKVFLTLLVFYCRGSDMEYKIISAFSIRGMTDVAIDAPQRGILNYKAARDEQGNLYEVLHPILPRTHKPPKASFLLKDIFKGETISLYINDKGTDEQD